jgi:AmmeMemoRadiSam system protein B
MTVRKPIVAGQFYPNRKEELMEQIDECFMSKFGPGKLPETGNGKHIAAAIVPHAGYFYSGACASHSYLEVAKSSNPDVFVMLGPNHSGMERTSVSADDWQTPLGIARNDVEFAEAMDIPINPSAHRFEHSIEVQLPFLQRIYGDDFRFVPIIITNTDGIAKKIAKASEITGKKITLIISSDMTHYGIGYGYLPFEDDSGRKMKELDMGAIEMIKRLDARGFNDYIQSTGATICGTGPINIGIEYCRISDATTVKLLKYYTSGDITGDHSTAVGYASLILR